MLVGVWKFLCIPSFFTALHFVLDFNTEVPNLSYKNFSSCAASNFTLYYLLLWLKCRYSPPRRIFPHLLPQAQKLSHSRIAPVLRRGYTHQKPTTCRGKTHSHIPMCRN